jgi:hypothetical protein
VPIPPIGPDPARRLQAFRRLIMQESLQLPARTVARLLVGIYGPAIYELPRYGGAAASAIVARCVE